jgi:predicted dehydrogenase
VSNAQNPALYGNVHVHGSSGASVGVQTDGGAMFIAGVSGIQEPPFNDLWTIPGEEPLKAGWRASEDALFAGPDAVDRFFRLQIADFLEAIRDARPPLVTLEDGRRAVELFTAIYRSRRDGAPVRFPLE